MMSTRAMREAQRRKRAFVIIVVGFVIVGAWISYLIFNPPVTRDDKNTCKPGDPLANVIVMIDKTDRWTEDQGDRLGNQIWDLVATRMRVDEKLWIFTFVDKVPASAPPAFARCKPPVTGNGVTESKKWIESKFKDAFADPLAGVISDVKRSEDHRCSPIAEAILDVLMRTEFREPKVPNKLVLFSDMRENSREYSLIADSKCAPRGASPASLQKFFAARRSEVTLDSVIVYQIPVGDKVPSQKVFEDDRIRAFWNDLFQRLDVPIVWRRL